MNFKVGDNVVVYRLESDAGDALKAFLGKTVTILEIYNYGKYPYSIDLKKKYSLGDTEIVAEELYNSPLFQALL